MTAGNQLSETKLRQRIALLQGFMKRAEAQEWISTRGTIKPSCANVAFNFLMGAWAAGDILEETGPINSGCLMIFSVRDPVCEARDMLARLEAYTPAA